MEALFRQHSYSGGTWPLLQILSAIAIIRPCACGGSNEDDVENSCGGAEN